MAGPENGGTPPIRDCIEWQMGQINLTNTAVQKVDESESIYTAAEATCLGEKKSKIKSAQNHYAIRWQPH